MSEQYNELWFTELENKFYTRIKYQLKDRSEAPFPKLNCTTVNQVSTPSKFPTLYLHELKPVEMGSDLYGKQIAALLYTLEIQVYSNVSETDAKEIMAQVIAEMKKMSFEVREFPDVSTNNKISTAIARFRRIIAYADKDIETL